MKIPSLYTDEQLKLMRVNLDHNSMSECPGFKGLPLNDIAMSKFGDVLRVIYESPDGNLVNDLQQFVSENSSPDLRAFVQNVLLVDIPSFKAAPDDETAFEMIVPRSLGSVADFQPFRNRILSLVSKYRDEYNSKHSSESSEASKSSE